MSDDSGFYAGVVVTILILLLTFAFTDVTDGVVPADYEKAVAACVNQEGVRKVLRPEYTHNDVTVICNNDTRVEFKSVEAR